MVEKMSAEFGKLYRDPAFVAFLEQQLVVSSPTTPAEFAAFLKEDRKAAESLIKLANTKRQEYKPH
jgi:tripartite-type tricarboxylate transporter receptor subunit TctC